MWGASQGLSRGNPAGSGVAAGEEAVLLGAGQARPAGHVANERLASVEDVDVAALDRGLRLELTAADPAADEDPATMLDHLEGPASMFELRDDRLADLGSGPRPSERSRLDRVRVDGGNRALDVRADRFGGEGPATNAVDAHRNIVERRLDARREVRDAAPEALRLAGVRQGLRRASNEDEERQREGDDGHDRQ